jgi:polyisoprenoid-binding protein YceI
MDRSFALNLHLFFLLALVRDLAAAAPFEIDQSQSRVEVVVNSTAGSFIGKLAKYQAALECEPPQLLPTKADLTFDFNDLKTGIRERDAHMLKWLQHSRNPTASFHLKSWRQERGGSVAVGELTIHGVQREIQMPVFVKTHGDNYNIDATVELDYRDFGLPKIRQVLLFSVDPHLKIRVHLVGRVAH